MKKVAVNLADLRKAITALKQRGFVRGGLDIARQGAYRRKPTFGIGATTTPSKSWQRIAQQPSRAQPGTVFTGGEGLHTTLSRGAPHMAMELPGFGAKLRSMSPAQREALNRVGLLHEGFEQGLIRGGKARPWFTHGGPAAILQESNTLATLPKNLQSVRDVFTDFRSISPEVSAIQAAMPSFQYGRTRLSRNAIRRLAPIIARKSRAQNKQFYRNIAGSLPEEFEAML